MDLHPSTIAKGGRDTPITHLYGGEPPHKEAGVEVYFEKGQWSPPPSPICSVFSFFFFFPFFFFFFWGNYIFPP
jgi:hypothetical protein